MAASTEEKKKRPPLIDTSAINDDGDEGAIVMSNMLMVCLLFIVHTATNALLLSAWNTSRCLFWNVGVCPPDLDWITNWLALGHLQVAILLAVLAKTAHGNPSQEVKLSYLVGVTLCIKMTVGILSKPHLHRPFLLVQLMVWTIQLVCLGWFTYTEYDEPLGYQARGGGGRTPTPRELFVAVSQMQHLGGSSRSLMSGVGSGSSTPRSTFDASSKFPVVTIALAVMVLGSFIQTLELVMLEEKSSYYVGTSANISAATRYYQSSADMVLIEKFIITIILGASLRFFDAMVQRNMLWAYISCMMLYQIMLAGGPGELMEQDPKRSTAVGTFFMILTAILGAV
mmetsp:Transcript_4969/g.8820  ORF Transcript_4969/g.8820 Transcript_4969/m.8820 type:complete len:341 (-) Transcript_4969:24-1046(-)